MPSVTTKSLYTQILEIIGKKALVTTSTALDSNKSSSSSEVASFVSTATTEEVLSAVTELLANVIEPRIISGLEVTQTSVPSTSINISAGSGTAGGKYYVLANPVTITLNFNTNEPVYYINLYTTGIKLEKKQTFNGLTLAKVIIPIIGRAEAIYNDKNQAGDNAYIQSFKKYNLYGYNDRFEEDTIELLRDNIGEILADNLIGNLRLSENLKITNSSGSLEMNSDSIKMMSSAGEVVAEFDNTGTYFYDENGVEIARFAVDGASIGNISIGTNSISSKNYVSEVSGFKINDSGSAEFSDVRIRGKISSSVFEYDKVSAVGGKLLVGNASSLSEVVNPTDNTITVTDSLFAVGDILRIKEGANEEYMEVTSIASAPTYSVTRDLADTYVTNPTWNKGTAIVSTGNGTSGEITGFISLDAVSSNSPFIDILLRNTSDYDDVTTKVRLGNLSGINDAEFGALSGFGLYADNAYIKGLIQASIICGSSICGSSITAGTITGACIQSGISNPRTVFDAYGISSYDSSGRKTTEIRNGCFFGENLTLQDPCCQCNYTYLNAGGFYFHDRSGGTTPYVKRLCSGSAISGETVYLPYWESSPKIQVGIKQLTSYNPNYTVNCQTWCVYYDNLEYYENSDGTYGYRFDVNAALIKSSGAYSECIVNLSECVGVCTHSDAITTEIKLNLIASCFNIGCSSCYYYGCYYYSIQYREVGAETWECCSYVYVQNHASTAEMLTSQCVSHCFVFPCSASREFKLVPTCTVWQLSTISGIACYECCQTVTPRAFNCSCQYYHCQYVTCIFVNQSCCQLFVAPPTTVYCSYFCICNLGGLKVCSNDGIPYYYTCLTLIINSHCENIITASCFYCQRDTTDETYGRCINLNCSICVPVSASSSPTLTYCYCVWSCICSTPGESKFWYISDECLSGIHFIQCYCSVTTNYSCCVMKLYSIKDYSGEETILDCCGTINYIAVGYY